MRGPGDLSKEHSMVGFRGSAADVKAEEGTAGLNATRC